MGVGVGLKNPEFVLDWRRGAKSLEQYNCRLKSYFTRIIDGKVNIVSPGRDGDVCEIRPGNHLTYDYCRAKPLRRENQTSFAGPFSSSNNQISNSRQSSHGSNTDR